MQVFANSIIPTIFILPLRVFVTLDALLDLSGRLSSIGYGCENPFFNLNNTHSAHTQGLQQIFTGPVVLNQNFLLITALHSHLSKVNARRFVRRKQNVIVSRIFMFLEHARLDITAQMIVPTGRNMTGPEDLFILDISSGNWQNLSAESQFPQRSRHRVILQSGVLLIDRGLIP